MFHGASFLINLSVFGILPLKHTGEMFENATVLNQPIGNWDVSSVTGMFEIFLGRPLLTNSSVIGMFHQTNGEMFNGASSFDQTQVIGMFLPLPQCHFVQPFLPNGGKRLSSTNLCQHRGFCGTTTNSAVNGSITISQRYRLMTNASRSRIQPNADGETSLRPRLPDVSPLPPRIQSSGASFSNPSIFNVLVPTR